MTTFIRIPRTDADGQTTGDVDTYEVEQDFAVARARRALRDAGLESAAVFAGDPEGEAVDTGQVFAAVNLEEVLARAETTAYRLVAELGPGADHPDGVWGRDAARHLWAHPEGEHSDGRFARDWVLDGVDDDDIEAEAFAAFTATYEKAWDEADS